MTSEVGTVFVPVPAVKVRLFVRLIVRLVAPVVATGTVITTGDHPAGVVSVATGACGFKAAHVAVEPATAVPQLYPHIGTTAPSGVTVVVGPAVKLTVCWPKVTTAPKRSRLTTCVAAFRIALILWIRIAFPRR
jgi:hypothetical protein